MVDPTPFFTRYGNYSWAAVKERRGLPRSSSRPRRLSRSTPASSPPPTSPHSTVFPLLDSRLHLGFDSQIHPCNAWWSGACRTSDLPNERGSPSGPGGPVLRVVRRSRPPRRVGGRPRGPERVDLVGQMLDLEGEDDPWSASGPRVGQMITHWRPSRLEQAGEDVDGARARRRRSSAPPRHPGRRAARPGTCPGCGRAQSMLKMRKPATMSNAPLSRSTHQFRVISCAASRVSSLAEGFCPRPRGRSRLHRVHGRSRRAARHARVGASLYHLCRHPGGVRRSPPRRCRGLARQSAGIPWPAASSQEWARGPTPGDHAAS